jgi:putative ABC transport system ATP-binding protein
MIRLEGVRRTYRKGDVRIDALDGVDLGVDRGEFVAVQGPSGSGKSTLMNIIGLLDRPDAGAYRLEGEDVSALGSDRLAALRNEKIGFVFQSFHLLPRATALENVELPLVYSSRRAQEGRGMHALTAVGMQDRARHEPSELSGGQQQRVAIARALVNDPDLILADEPTGNLDSASGLGIMHILQGLHAQGRTIVLITHDEHLARMAGRVVRVHDGRIHS